MVAALERSKAALRGPDYVLNVETGDNVHAPGYLFARKEDGVKQWVCREVSGSTIGQKLIFLKIVP